MGRPHLYGLLTEGPRSTHRQCTMSSCIPPADETNNLCRAVSKHAISFARRPTRIKAQRMALFSSAWLSKRKTTHVLARQQSRRDAQHLVLHELLLGRVPLA